MHIQIVAYKSALYDEMTDRREDWLRKPIGLTRADFRIQEEEKEIHIAAIDAGRVVGVLVLQPQKDQSVKMRQVAVDPKRRGQGIGRALLLFAEAHAKKGGFLVMTCHARETAVSFYEKHGYQTVSHPFEEVGLPHVRMEKRLSDPFL
ncbi:MAG: GNAT family N-acetyltransferase [Tissierellia bacterium]|jgi:ribosomal protein S18 acetylase RimI-like enzyme|nr:GNAT family N-acetyltransferase [Bacillota bacterium]NLK58656.1 GNAT family N-acetyltransferase [Tissierellia bacterium]